MSKLRPGVEAGKRLSRRDDIKIWHLVESQYDTNIVDKVKDLKQIDHEYKKLGEQLQEVSKLDITKEELLLVVKWKFSVGKPRHALMKHLAANSDSSVRKQSAVAMELARQIAIKTGHDMDNYAVQEIQQKVKASLEALTCLQGVGPATASAILSLVRPDWFAYMYDEAIECFLPRRNYTLSTYITVNENCRTIATKLGKGWTCSRVAKALWTACRANAYGFSDHTIERMAISGSAKKEPSRHTDICRPKKKQRR